MFHGSLKLQNFVSEALSLSDRVNDIIDPFCLHELDRYDAAKAKDCLLMLLDIGVRCAQELPQFRPDIRDISSVLETIKSIYQAGRVGTEAYAQGSFQAAVLMAQRNNKSLQWNRTQVPNSSPEMTSNSVTVSYMDLHEATNGFSSTNLVGAGGFGSVYKGIFHQKKFSHLARHSDMEAGSGTAVAIKVFNLQRRGAVKSFNTEYQTLKEIDHKYIVKIITACISVDQEGRNFRAILFEFMDHGSLQMWLHAPNVTNYDESITPPVLSLLARINIAIDVACALDYLHRQCKNCVIHCDLKPGNILIDKNMFARIADFGLAISLPESPHVNQCSSSTGIRGTTGYIAPEYGLGCKMTIKGDTYSFGILLLEMLTSKKPTHLMFRRGLNLHNFVWMALPDNVIDITDPLIKVMTSERDVKRVEKLLTRIFNIGLACSKPSPKDRPDMHVVLRELESVRSILYLQIVNDEDKLSV